MRRTVLALIMLVATQLPVAAEPVHFDGFANGYDFSFDNSYARLGGSLLLLSPYPDGATFDDVAAVQAEPSDE